MMTRTLFYTLGFALAAILTTGGAGAALAADITGSVDVFVPGQGMLNANVNAVGQGTATLDTDAMQPMPAIIR